MTKRLSDAKVVVYLCIYIQYTPLTCCALNTPASHFYRVHMSVNCVCLAIFFGISNFTLEYLHIPSFVCLHFDTCGNLALFTKLLCFATLTLQKNSFIVYIYPPILEKKNKYGSKKIVLSFVCFRVYADFSI